MRNLYFLTPNIFGIYFTQLNKFQNHVTNTNTSNYYTIHKDYIHTYISNISNLTTNIQKKIFLTSALLLSIEIKKKL